MSYWTVALTKPLRENTAAENLARQGFPYYLPKYLEKSGKLTKVKILFPRYIFIQIESQWHSINSTFGVSHLILTNESTPAKIDDRIIDRLKSQEDKGYIQLQQKEKFQQGENVRIADGALQGYIGIYEGMKDHERVRVLIELLGRKVSIEVSEASLRAVASESQ